MKGKKGVLKRGGMRKFSLSEGGLFKLLLKVEGRKKFLTTGRKRTFLHIEKRGGSFQKSWGKKEKRKRITFTDQLPEKNEKKKRSLYSSRKKVKTGRNRKRKKGGTPSQKSSRKKRTSCVPREKGGPRIPRESRGLGRKKGPF